MSAPNWEMPAAELPFDLPSNPGVFDDGTGGSEPHDAGVVLYPHAGADEPPSWVYGEDMADAGHHFVGVISAGLNFLPMAGQLKNLIEGFVGKDLITGHHLSWWERALNVASVLPVIPGAHGIKHLIGEIGHNAHRANKLVHGAHGLIHAHGMHVDGEPGDSAPPPILEPPTIN